MYISKTTLLIVCAVMVTFIILTCHYSSTPLQGSSEQVDTLEWVNDAGDLVTSLKASPEYFAEHDKELRDSFANVYKTKAKNVQEFVSFTTKGTTDLKPIGRPLWNDTLQMIYEDVPGSTLSTILGISGDLDTIVLNREEAKQGVMTKSAYQEFQSKYYKAQVQIGDSSYMHLQSFDTITVLWKKVTEGSIFNRRNLIQLDVSTANPDTRVSGIKAYRISEKPKRWAVGIGAGYGVPLYGNSFQAVPFIGISIQKTIIRF